MSVSHEWLPLLVFLVGGLTATSLGVLGIVFLAKRLKNQESASKTVLVVLIIGLALLALAGLFAAGCAAVIALSPLA